MEIHIPDSVRLTGQAVLTDIRLYHEDKGTAGTAKLRVERVAVEIEPPVLGDAGDDFSRLKEALASKMGIRQDSIRIEYDCLQTLPHKIREKGFALPVTLIHEGRGATILSLADSPLYGLAVDIGTTTIVMALCDLETGFVLDTVGMPNPQGEYGADVINRIVFTEEYPEGMSLMRGAVIHALTESIRTLAGRVNIDPADIPVMTVAGNTVMSHFLLGLPCDFLRREPYVPAAREYPALKPSDLGLPIMPWGRVIVLPGVSSYVGGDIVAGVVATGLASLPGLSVLVDVGTNGEIVLAGEGYMVACSCSAGPAFEGSGISCGSRAVSGAVDNVYYHKGHMVFDVIGGHRIQPASICGSGLISMLSALLQKGAIDRAGRFTTEEKAFALTPEVVITQPDVTNLIRSKAAIYAGMRVLANRMEIKLSDVDRVYIAGGFGRNLNIEYAISIGMLPHLPHDAFAFVGNSALAGALMVLNDRTIDTVETAASILNLELSADNMFMDEFIKASFLPHTEELF
jgi:uncharacterized 2Fe-2S/4Fe-4S cluster protein (DUF4445 family)